MDRFLPFTNELGEHINFKAAELYDVMQALDVAALKLPYHCEQYFIGSHSSRLFFSIETAAHILYHSIKKSGKKVEDIIFMDYGAGVGSLFLLAKRIGCKKVIYSDHLEDWKKSASIIANATATNIDHYIVQDYKECLQELRLLNIKTDIIASRNVVEHIYNLPDFFNTVFEYQPEAMIFSSTTANIKNPALVIRHKMIHARWEKDYMLLRKKIIEKKGYDFSEKENTSLAKNTRGLAMEDLDKAIENFRLTKKMPDPTVYGTNTCQPENGLWAENLISFEKYREYINQDRYNIIFQPGFWDTHYSKKWKNLIGKSLNKLKRYIPSLAFSIAPFIYIIAEPKKQNV